MRNGLFVRKKDISKYSGSYDDAMELIVHADVKIYIHMNVQLIARGKVHCQCETLGIDLSILISFEN